MNNNDNINPQKENQTSQTNKNNETNEINIHSQNKNTEIIPEQNSEENKEQNNEKPQSNNHLYKELLIEDNSINNNNDKNTENILKNNENNELKNIEQINNLNDYYSSEEYNGIIDRSKNIITVNDIIGSDTKKEINLNIMDESFNNFYSGKVSTKSYGPIKAYAANTNQGIARDYNEDRVSIIININHPNNKNLENVVWPKASYFSVFDGHGGNKCAEFLRDNLLKLICDNDFFPNDIEKAIKYGFSEADKLFLENAIKDGELIDNSGSCGLILLIIDNKIYIANVGDSRCIISMKNGTIRKDVTRDHKPNYPYEKERIVANGGRIYQTQTPLNQNLDNENNDNNSQNNENNLILLGPHRVFPGSLSVSRTVGDAAAKITSLGGNPKVVISEPDIYCFDLDKEDIDFLILGCDGIYDQLTSQDVFKCAYMMIDFCKNYNLKENINEKDKEENDEKEEINLYTTCANIVDFILKASMARKSFDNVTCLIVAFKDLLSDNNNDNIKNENNINDNDNNNIVKNNVKENEEKEKNEEKNTKKVENLFIEKEIQKQNSENNIVIDKKDVLPKLVKTNDILLENNKNDKNENNENKKIINITKKKIIIDKIQIKSIQKEDKTKNNVISNKFNKQIDINPYNNESPNKNDINSGELSHRAINNNLLKEFKYKANKGSEKEKQIFFSNKNKLTLSTTKMKNSKSKEMIIDRNKNKILNKNLDKNNKEKNNNIDPLNNLNYKANNINLSLKKNRLNSTKKYFLNKKIKPLFIDKKTKYPNNFTLKITLSSDNNNNNINNNINNHHTKTGGSLNKLIPGMGGLNLYQNHNLNMRDKNPPTFSNIPKITNINTIMVKNSIKNKITLNDLLPFNNGKNGNNINNRNMLGLRLKSLNKKSISFYNNFAFNEFINNNKIINDKNNFQKNKQSQFDLLNFNSNSGRNSYVNIKAKNGGNININQNGNKYHFSSEDKYKIKLGKPINICSVNTNGINNNKRHPGNDFKGKKMIHNLTEDLLSGNNRNEIPSINSKNKINNNITNTKK